MGKLHCNYFYEMSKIILKGGFLLISKERATEATVSNPSRFMMCNTTIPSHDAFLKTVDLESLPIRFRDRIQI